MSDVNKIDDVVVAKEPKDDHVRMMNADGNAIVISSQVMVMALIKIANVRSTNIVSYIDSVISDIVGLYDEDVKQKKTKRSKKGKKS